MIICPFHDDRTKSMSVKFEKAHCFACNRNWDKIDFLIERDGLTFKEAISILLDILKTTQVFLSQVGRTSAPYPAPDVRPVNIIFNEFGGWTMFRSNVGKWFVPNFLREEFKELRRSGYLMEV